MPMHRLSSTVLRRLGGAVVLLVCTATLAAAQATGSIRGRVTDAGSQRPLGSAQVQVAGSALGALSNANGEYSIVNVPEGTHSLTIRRLGYARVTRSVTVTAGSETRVDVEVSSAPASLDAVVVTGTAGEVEKRTLGNAITQLDVADLKTKTNVTNVTEVLQSKSPGVSILPGSGTTGTSGEIRIRGASSLSGYKPVVYIDGIRYNIESLGNFNPTGSGIAASSSQVTSGLDMISPNDIESIEVIKGPAAATLYGADAAGGVIQIITKKGTRGQQRAQWSAKVERGADKWALDPAPNLTTCDAAKIAARTPKGEPAWPGCQGVDVNTVLSQNPLMQDPTAIRTGDLSRYSLSLRGGGDKYSFYLAGDRDEDQGVFHNSYNKRNAGRANFTVQPSSNTDFAFTMSYIQNHLRLPVGDESANALALSATRGRPGSCGAIEVTCWSTITPALANAYDNQTNTERLTIGGTMNYRPFGWFRNRLTTGLDVTSAVAQLLSLPGSADSPSGLSAQKLPRTHIYSLDYVGSAEGAVRPNLISTTSVGAQVVARRDETVSASGVGLGAPDVTLINSATQLTASNTYSENNSVGYFGQEQLGWNNRLFLIGAVRIDNNSSFGDQVKVIAYPKASLSWVLSEEPSMKRFFDYLHTDNFKFRTAWGQAGRAPAPFSQIQTYTVDRVATGGGDAVAIRTSAYGNPDLKPERGTETELGFDAGLFQDRAAVEFTYYSKRMNDMLITQSVPPSSGFPTTRYMNLGVVTNKGIELGITVSPVIRPRFTWDSRLTASTNRNRLVSFGDTTSRQTISGQPYGAVQENRVGYPLGGYWSGAAKRNADGSPALIGGAVDTTAARYIGSSVPTRELGFSNTFTFFKNWRVYALLDYKGGQYLFNQRHRNQCQAANSNCAEVNDPRALFPATASDSLMAKELIVLRSRPDPFIEPADFIKLRDLSLTYTLPQSLLARIGSESASLTLAGHNLAVWTKYDGADPEVNSYGGRLFARADTYTTPMLRRVTLALNLGF
jgi:TonB-linked SusC/RagA family outer membrane protein